MQSNVCANEVDARQMKFFSDRLAHRVPLEVMFWRDMIMAGTAINLFFLGAAAGILNVFRAAKEMQRQGASLPPAPAVIEDEDDER